MKNINIILLTIISLVLLVSVNAATVSHSASEITAGTFGAGDFTITNNQEVFLGIKNTETNGRDFRLVSAGSGAGIGVGKFSIYDSTAGQSRLVIDTSGNVGIGTTTPNAKLDVIGRIKIGGFSTLPTCDSSSEGTIAYNTQLKKLVICIGTGWDVFSTGIDFDGDGFISGIDCDDGDFNLWQLLTGYRDKDLDTYTAGGAQSVCSGSSLPSGWRSSQKGNDCNDDLKTEWQSITGYPDSDGDDRFSSSGTSFCSGSSLPSGYSSSAGNDCDDGCSTCYPGSGSYTTSPDGRDQNCNGAVDEGSGGGSATCNLGDAENRARVSRGISGDGCSSFCGAAGGSITGKTGFDGYVVTQFWPDGGWDWNTCNTWGNVHDLRGAPVYWGTSTCNCNTLYR